MAGQILYPNGPALALAANIKAGYLTGFEVHLFKSDLSINRSTTLADCLAAECDYDGYAPITDAEFGTPYIDPERNGASIQAHPQFDFGPAGDPVVANMVGGFFITSAAAAALKLVGSFDQPIPMSVVGDSVPCDFLLNYGGGS